MKTALAITLLTLCLARTSYAKPHIDMPNLHEKNIVSTHLAGQVVSEWDSDILKRPT